MNRVKLGCQVRDLVSGIEGIAHSMCEKWEGGIQFAVQPKCGPDNKLPDAWNFDIQQLEVIGPGCSDRLVDHVEDGIVLGNIYEDAVSGFSGTAINRTTYLNGCVFILLEARIDPDKKDQKREDRVQYFPCQRMKLVKDNQPKPTSDEGAPPKAKEIRGGPIERAPRL